MKLCIPNKTFRDVELQCTVWKSLTLIFQLGCSNLCRGLCSLEWYTIFFFALILKGFKKFPFIAFVGFFWQSEAASTVLSFSAAVELEYSLDLGLTWQPLVRDCLPTSPDCSSYTLQRLLVADTYNKWGRVTLPIPSYARSASPTSRVRISTLSVSHAAVFCKKHT